MPKEMLLVQNKLLFRTSSTIFFAEMHMQSIHYQLLVKFSRIKAVAGKASAQESPTRQLFNKQPIIKEAHKALWHCGPWKQIQLGIKYPLKIKFCPTVQIYSLQVPC